MPGTRAAQVFSPEETAVFFAVIDTIGGPVDADELVRMAPSLAKDNDRTAIEAWAAEKPSSNPDIKRALTEILPSVLLPKQFAELKQVCMLLRGRVGALMLCGGYTPFVKLSIPERERVMLNWKTSRVPAMRKIYTVLSILAGSIYTRYSTIAHAGMGYRLKNTPSKPENHYKFDFLTAADLGSLPPLDAIVVGSGLGGGVAAKLLSEAGMKVLVIEKGMYEDLTTAKPITEAESLQRMIEASCLSITESGDMAVVSASTFGGGGTINWAACLEPPQVVRNDWRSTFDLPYFTSPEFQADLDQASKTIGRSLPKRQNKCNTLLMEGASRMGYSFEEVPQNNGNADHECGHECANGCRSGGKKGGTQLWLVDAAKAGCLFMQGCSVRKILFAGKAKHAEGVVVRLPDGSEHTIKAPRVIAAAGSIQNPSLFVRSKISNPRIGNSLYVHPTNYVYGVFDEFTDPTEGQILTSMVDEHAARSASGHGVRVEVGIMQPTISMTLMQWNGPLEYKSRLAKHQHMLGSIAICRDLRPGKVVTDSRGEPTIHYTVGQFDVESIIRGTITSAECMRAAGAKEVIVGAKGVESWKDGQDFDAWKRKVEKTRPGAFGTAHQMATCRMSGKGDGVCDPTGAVVGVDGVWCCDASVLPSASGVNPMLTILGTSHMVVRSIIADWKSGVRERRGSVAVGSVSSGGSSPSKRSK